MRKHTVTFVSPGTLFSETTTKDIGEWDIRKAIEMSESIVERYGARPYAFYFETWVTRDPVDDGEGGKLDVKPKSVADSPLYYLGGKIETYPEVLARNAPDESILRSNMRCNQMPAIVVSISGYKSVHQLRQKDIVLAADGSVVAHGADYSWQPEWDDAD